VRVEPERIARNLAGVRTRMKTARERSGRAGRGVRLVAVTKTVDAQTVIFLRSLGVVDFGENRVQELTRKAALLEDLMARDERKKGSGAFCANHPSGPKGLRLLTPFSVEEIHWHMIGHLQRNKVKHLLSYSRMLHSLDSAALAEAVSRRAAEAGVEATVLIEVNVSGEETKGGVSPGEAASLAEVVVKLPAVKLRGLMTLAPVTDDAQKVRPLFASLRELAGKLGRDLPEDAMSELSMGMSQDFEVAIEEGATMVRIGSALFA
jgi:hypothetical protein